MNLLKKLRKVGKDIKYELTQAREDGFNKGFDGLENEVAEALGEVGANVDFTVVEHVAHLVKERDRLLKDEKRLDWLSWNRSIRDLPVTHHIDIGAHAHNLQARDLRVAIDKEMEKEDDQSKTTTTR